MHVRSRRSWETWIGSMQRFKWNKLPKLDFSFDMDLTPSLMFQSSPISLIFAISPPWPPNTYPPYCAFTNETRTCLVYKRCHNCSQQPTTPWEKWNSAFRPHSSSVHRTQFRCSKYLSVQRRHGYQSNNTPKSIQFGHATHAIYNTHLHQPIFSVWQFWCPAGKPAPVSAYLGKEEETNETKVHKI